MVDLAETRPVLSVVDVDKSWEIEGRVVADVLAASLLGRVQEEVGDAFIDGCHVLELSDEWPNVLEGSASHNLGSWVLQELKVELLHLSGLLLQWADLGNFSNHVCARLSNLLLFVSG